MISLSPVIMNNVTIESVQEYKYLGSMIDSKLSWNTNTNTRFADSTISFILMKLRSFNVDKNYADIVLQDLRLDYIDLLYSVCGEAQSLQNKNKLSRVVKLCSKINGGTICNITLMPNQYTMNLADPQHPLWSEYELLPSGQGYNKPRMWNRRGITSFVPCSIQLLNKL